MSVSSDAIEPNLEQRCEVCGATLTTAEITTAREEGRPFLCTVHAVEELPAIPEDVGDE